jgi:protein PsiE|tara:strand:- start:118 stop:504 length:387 start_codon:yes stop_codon:yes gene_type:complete
MDQAIKVIEKILLIAIAVATIFATGQEIFTLIENRSVQLADLLLLFIYTEVLGMVGVFYKSNRIPITLPLFIAITALSRMIILQGKGSDPQNLIYESAAVLLLAISCLIIRQPSITSLFGKDPDDNDN